MGANVNHEQPCTLSAFFTRVTGGRHYVDLSVAA